ncbi:hypothetical protein D3C86_2184460 [compost metagenome]
MLYDPVEQKHDAAKKFAEELHKNPTLYERFMSIKQRLVLKSKPQNKKGLKSLFLMFTVLFK